MEVHLVDGTYELFRQFFGQRYHSGLAAQDGSEVGATAGVVSSVLTMLEQGATHVAVATDHKVESFRNEMWPGYKTSAGVAPELLSQFSILEDSLRAMGVFLLAMDELEADDGLSSAAFVAGRDAAVERVLIWTPDKDLAQCVSGSRIVQVDRRNDAILDEAAIVAKFGVKPASIPDWLGLVGDAADCFPGLRGWGKRSAAVVLSYYDHIEEIPLDASQWAPDVLSRVRSAGALAGRLGEDFELALLFRDLATLRVDESLVKDTDTLCWRGPAEGYSEMAAYLSSPRLAERAEKLASRPRA